MKKIKCQACGEKKPASELKFNEAEHEINVCTDCATAAESEVKKEQIAKLVKKGTDKKEAKTKVAGMNLEKRTIKLLTELIEADVMDEDETGAGGKTEDIDVDETETVKPPKVKPGKTTPAPAAPAPKNGKTDGKVMSAEKLTAKIEALREKRKTAPRDDKAGISAEIDALKLQLKSVKSGATPAPAAPAPKVKPGKTTPAPVVPAKPVKAPKAPATPAGIEIEIDGDSIAKYTRMAIKHAKEAMTTHKAKKGEDVSEIFVTKATEEFEALVSGKLFKLFKTEAKETGAYSTVKKAIKAAVEIDAE
jgi:hypothetical protein